MGELEGLNREDEEALGGFNLRAINLMYLRVQVRVNEQTDEWTDGQMDRRTNERM